jgi:D-alanyl-D-alanine dipeptidase
MIYNLNMKQMSLEEKLERSRSTENVDFSKYQSINIQDPLVKIISTKKVLVEPNWTIPGDFEGGMYADYITEHPEYDGVYVRSELLKKVESAANSLSDPYKLVIRAGHRPIEVQKRLLKECAADYKRDHPGISDEEALEHARDFVSDPDSTLPPHVCGAAVDVEIMGVFTGNYLDFGTAIGEDNEKSFLYYPDLTEVQKANRLLLVTAMLDAGLASCMTEWWHYSYGDQLWAWFYEEQNSLYSPIDL